MTADDRSCIYDIYCENENGEKFIVEMQNRGHQNFKERAIYYLSRSISNQGEKGLKWLFDLKAVYGVFFMNFHLEGQKHKRLRTDVTLWETQTNKPFSDKMRFIFLDLPAFTKDEETCETDFERWIYILKNMEILQRMPFKARKSVLEELERLSVPRKTASGTTRASRSTAITSPPSNGLSRWEKRKVDRSDSRKAYRSDKKEAYRSDGRKEC